MYVEPSLILPMRVEFPGASTNRRPHPGRDGRVHGGGRRRWSCRCGTACGTTPRSRGPTSSRSPGHLITWSCFDIQQGAAGKQTRLHREQDGRTGTQTASTGHARPVHGGSGVAARRLTEGGCGGRTARLGRKSTFSRRQNTCLSTTRTRSGTCRCSPLPPMYMLDADLSLFPPCP